MPKVDLRFDIRGWVTQRVELPQGVIEGYNRMCEAEPVDDHAIDQLLQPYIRYEDILDQLDDAEDIELTELKSEERQLA